MLTYFCFQFKGDDYIRPLKFNKHDLLLVGYYHLGTKLYLNKDGTKLHYPNLCSNNFDLQNYQNWEYSYLSSIIISLKIPGLFCNC